MGWGRVSPAPWALPVSPCRLERGVQAFISPSLVVPGAVDVLHIGLLSVPVLVAPGLFIVLGGVPLDNYDYSTCTHTFQLASCINMYPCICEMCVCTHAMKL